MWSQASPSQISPYENTVFPICFLPTYPNLLAKGSTDTSINVPHGVLCEDTSSWHYSPCCPALSAHACWSCLPPEERRKLVHTVHGRANVTVNSHNFILIPVLCKRNKDSGNLGMAMQLGNRELGLKPLTPQPIPFPLFLHVSLEGLAGYGQWGKDGIFPCQSSNAAEALSDVSSSHWPESPAAIYLPRG